jgi:hypothetical protein
MASNNPARKRLVALAAISDRSSFLSGGRIFNVVVVFPIVPDSSWGLANSVSRRWCEIVIARQFAEISHLQCHSLMERWVREVAI